MAVEAVHTIGVYGWEADAFLSALRQAGIDLLCDVRARRGVRGPDYAFANARRLQELLAAGGIAYRHVPELAMPDDLRARQGAADRAAGVGQRSRTALDAEVARGYAALLEREPAAGALAALAGAAARPCLMCVEGTPAACHRSLAAEALAAAADAPVRHLLPG